MAWPQFGIAQSFCCFERLILWALQAHSSGVNSQENRNTYSPSSFPFYPVDFPLSVLFVTLFHWLLNNNPSLEQTRFVFISQKYRGSAHVSMPNRAVFHSFTSAFGLAAWPTSLSNISKFPTQMAFSASSILLHNSSCSPNSLGFRLISALTFSTSGAILKFVLIRSRVSI